MKTITKSVFAEKAEVVFSRTHRSCRVVGHGDPPVTPYYQGRWRLEILKSESTMPVEVQTRLKLLNQEGIKFKHILIAHELPKEVKKLEIPKEVISVASKVLPVLGTILWAVGAVVGMLGIALARMVLFILAVDPVV